MQFVPVRRIRAIGTQGSRKNKNQEETKMIDVTKVEVNEMANEVIITGTDLDSLWLFHEPDEDAECKEISYKFDISLAGVRKYLFVITKNNEKANKFKYMNKRLEALVGQTIHFSDNFRMKDDE